MLGGPVLPHGLVVAATSGREHAPRQLSSVPAPPPSKASAGAAPGKAFVPTRRSRSPMITNRGRSSSRPLAPRAHRPCLLSRLPPVAIASMPSASNAAHPPCAALLPRLRWTATVMSSPSPHPTLTRAHSTVLSTIPCSALRRSLGASAPLHYRVSAKNACLSTPPRTPALIASIALSALVEMICRGTCTTNCLAWTRRKSATRSLCGRRPSAPPWHELHVHNSLDCSGLRLAATVSTNLGRTRSGREGSSPVLKLRRVEGSPHVPYLLRGFE